MKKYELMYILKPGIEGEERKAEIEKLGKILTDLGAKITKTDESLGLRDLAYPINKETKGYYVVLKLEMDNMEAMNEFDRLSKINSNVMRYLLTVDEQ
ncbi:MAG: 30S ribosomal protein S6 [Bacillales bacterium]